VLFHKRGVASNTAATSILSLMICCAAAAENNLGMGVWATYEYLPGDDASEETFGQIKDEAVILYADGSASEGEGRLLYSSELRIGPGSFTDPDNNSTGDQVALHKAWVGWQLNDNHVVKVGKSQVPFGWKTHNFWPGDILLAGFGDQMDVGVKLTGDTGPWSYDAAFYLADDWGGESTDTVDDNGHWGTSDTYRKVQTLVGDLGYELADNQRIALSLQAGKIQDLTGLGDDDVDGDHWAAVAYYEGRFDNNTWLKASYIANERDMPDLHAQNAGLADTIENQRLAFEVGYDRGPYSFYIDASLAEPDTRGSDADTVFAFTPGFRYDYGPGWFYVEYLYQDGFVDANGQVGEGDFDALYITLDFYL